MVVKHPKLVLRQALTITLHSISPYEWNVLYNNESFA